MPAFPDRLKILRTIWIAGLAPVDSHYPMNITQQQNKPPENAAASRLCQNCTQGILLREKDQELFEARNLVV